VCIFSKVVFYANIPKSFSSRGPCSRILFVTLNPKNAVRAEKNEFPRSCIWKTNKGYLCINIPQHCSDQSEEVPESHIFCFHMLRWFPKKHPRLKKMIVQEVAYEKLLKGTCVYVFQSSILCKHPKKFFQPRTMFSYSICYVESEKRGPGWEKWISKKLHMKN